MLAKPHNPPMQWTEPAGKLRVVFLPEISLTRGSFSLSGAG